MISLNVHLPEPLYSYTLAHIYNYTEFLILDIVSICFVHLHTVLNTTVLLLTLLMPAFNYVR